jgi:hypothetical protein
MGKKESFSLLSFQNGFYNLQKNYVIYYLIKCIIWTFPNIDVCITYPWKKIEVNCIFKYIPFDSFKMKIIIQTRIQNDIYIISNLVLDFLIKLTWHHFSYNHTPIGWFKSDKSPCPKSSYFNTKIKKQLQTNFEWALCGDVSTNKVHTKGYPFKQFFDIHARGKKYESDKKWQDTKIRFKFGYLEV